MIAAAMLIDMQSLDMVNESWFRLCPKTPLLTKSTKILDETCSPVMAFWCFCSFVSCWPLLLLQATLAITCANSQGRTCGGLCTALASVASYLTPQKCALGFQEMTTWRIIMLQQHPTEESWYEQAADLFSPA